MMALYSILAARLDILKQTGDPIYASGSPGRSTVLGSLSLELCPKRSLTSQSALFEACGDTLPNAFGGTRIVAWAADLRQKRS